MQDTRGHRARVLRNGVEQSCGTNRGNIMQRTWTSRLCRLAAAAGVGGACWMLSAGMGVGQTTTTTSDTNQTTGSASITASPRAGSTSQSTTRTTQSGRSSNDETQGVGGTYSS